MSRVLKTVVCMVFATALIVAESNAQTVKLKEVFGNGGMVGAVNGKIKMSGIVGQIAIGKLGGQSPSGEKTIVYQGFWTPLADTITGVDDNPSVSLNSKLSNYPNPFSSQTAIKFELETASSVSIKIYDMVGHVVGAPFDGYQNAGAQNVLWTAKSDDGTELSAGSYICEVSIRPNLGGEPIMLRSVMVVVK